jgi:hypothetical protein
VSTTYDGGVCVDWSSCTEYDGWAGVRGLPDKAVGD